MSSSSNVWYGSVASQRRRGLRSFGSRSAAALLMLATASCADVDPNELDESAPYDDEVGEEADQNVEIDESRAALSLILPSSLPVVLVRYRTTSAAFNATPAGRAAPAGVDPYRDLFFGSTFPTVKGYYNTMSGNRFSIHEAGVYEVVENDALDAAAGITPAMKADTNGDGVWDGHDEVYVRRVAYYLQQANFNFGTYNVRDVAKKEITADELGIVVIQQGHNSGANRGTLCIPVKDRGETYKLCTFNAYAGDQGSFMNFTHELTHTMGMKDLYADSCYGKNVTTGSCTAGETNGQQLYYIDPYYRRAWNWTLSTNDRDVNVSSTSSGSQRLRPASRNTTTSGTSTELLTLRRGSEAYVFEYRKPDSQYERNVSANGIIVWYVKTDANGELVRTRFADPLMDRYDPVRNVWIKDYEWADYPVPADRCHIDEMYGRGIVSTIPANKWLRLRSEKTPWNIAVNVSAVDAQGGITVSWTPMGDDNSCGEHNGQSSTFTVARTADNLDVLRGAGGDTVIKDATWQTGGVWGNRTLPTAFNGLGPVTVVSKSPTTVDAFAVDSTGAVVWSTFDGFSWSFWTAITGANEANVGTQIAATSRQRDVLDIFWVSRAGVLKTGYKAGGNNWGFGDLSIWLSPTTNVVATARSEWRLNVYAASADNYVYEWEWRPSKGWHPPRLVMAGVGPTRGRTAIARNRERLEFFAVGEDGSLRTAYRNLEGAAPDGPVTYTSYYVTQMNLRPWSPLASVARNSGWLDLFGIDTSGRVVSIFNGWGGGWSSPFAITGPSSLGAVAGVQTQLSVVARNPNHLDVFTGDAHGNLTTLFWDANGGWFGPFAMP